MKSLYRIFSYVGYLWPYYLAVVISGLLVSGLNLASPFIMKRVTDTIVGGVAHGGVDVSSIMWLAVLLFVADAAVTFIQNWSGYLGDVMSAKLRQVLSDRYYRHLLSLSQSYYDNELTGTIINRLNRTITEVTQFINMFANNFFSMYLTLIVSLVILLAYSWQLAVMMALVYPLFMWLTTKTSRRWQAWQKEKNLETDIASGRFAEVVAQIRVVKSFVREKAEFSRFASRNQRIVQLTREQSRYWHKMDIARRFVLNVIFFGATAYIFVATARGQFTVGDLVLLTTLLTQMRFPVFNMSFIVDNLQKAVAGSRDYFEVMEVVPAVQDKKGAKKLRVTKGAITYDHVTFGYDAEETVLHDVSLAVDAGKKIAFVGKSGEGKTTLTSLLLRAYDVDKGTIQIDGISLRDVTQRSLHEQVAVVFQEPALFSGTIRENIAYGKPTATTEQIMEAARLANASEFIDRLDHGIDTEIGERGLKLSGGQKQRIAIARAILKDAPILILDEATSSLDSHSERLVQEALDRLMQGRTVLIIAHRLSTIANVDTIVTLKNGRVDEIGAPAKLAKTGGIYGQLLDLQMGMSERDKKALKKYEIAG